MPIAQVSTTIRNWAHKLIVDGVLKIATPDIYALAKIFANNQLSTRDFVVSIFGTQQDTDACMSATDAPTLVKILEEHGLVIKTKRYDGLIFYVEAVRENK